MKKMKKRFIPVNGCMFITRFQIENDAPEVAGTLPPSKYVVLDPGNSPYKKGNEVKLKPMSKLISLEDGSDEYIVEISEIAAYR